MSERKRAANRANARQPRQLRLTAELIAIICEAVRAGVRPETAAALNGVPSRTYREWMEKARDDNARPLLVELQAGIELACAEWEAGDILLIGQAARQENPGEWTAAAWRLERRLPSIYAKKTEKKVDHTITIELERRELSTRMLEAAQRVLGADPELLERFAAALGGGEVVDGEALELPEGAA